MPNGFPGASAPDDLLGESAEMVLIRNAICCFLQIMPRRKADKYLKLLAESLATEDAVTKLVPLRSATRHADSSLERRKALDLFRASLPFFMSSVRRR